MPTPNPIEKRLNKVAEEWENLVIHETARLGRFIGSPDDRQLFDTFLKIEDEEEGQVPDLFVRITAPFERADQFVLAALLTLEHKAQAMGEAAAEAEKEEAEKAPPFPRDWQAPKPTPGGDPADVWMAAVISWVDAYGPFYEAFGFYIDPDTVSSAHEYMRFLYTVAKHPKHPAKARHMVFDDAAQPGLKPLADAERVRIATVPLMLDMPGALNELAEQNDDGSPGGQFRKHYMAAATSAGKGDMSTAAAKGKSALAIAEEQKWPGLQVVVHLVLAAGYLGQKGHEPAFTEYEKAHAAANAAKVAGDPTGPKLELQALAGKAATRVSQGDFERAGREYEIMAQKAEAAGDERMTLEGHRMAGYCRESLKDYEGAFQLNGKAAKVAEQMKPEDRELSTLPYVGQALTRITQKVRKDQAAAVKAYIDKLLPGWENKVQRRPDGT
jgi:tetratricopeptide (TPR) repeat protein